MNKKIKLLNDRINLLHGDLIKAEKCGNEKLVKLLLRKHTDAVQLRYKQTQKG